MTLKAVLMVFIGGGLGSLLRYALSLALVPWSQKFPYATLTANVLSCVLLGFLIGITTKNALSTEMKLFLMVGLCGGFSTFSTFSAESYQLFNTGTSFLALVYMGVSFFICLVAIYGGIKLAG